MHAAINETSGGLKESVTSMHEGLAVLGFMFEVTNETNQNFDFLVSRLQELKKESE